MIMVVYVVRFSNYSPAEVDSLWLQKPDAEKRAAELNGDARGWAPVRYDTAQSMWAVEEWEVK